MSLARRLYQGRVDRRMFFREALFGESGWDGLLALYLSEAAGKILSAGELRTASGEPSLTTALRTQRRLADIGIIRRWGDPADRRRTMIELAPSGREKLEAYLDHLLDNFLPAAIGPDTAGEAERPARLLEGTKG